jgi:hypothetical protein
MKRLALVTVGALALAAPALANVGAGKVKAGNYKGSTSQKKSSFIGLNTNRRDVHLRFSASTMHNVQIPYRLGCRSGQFIVDSTNISSLGPITGKHASFTATGDGPFGRPTPIGTYRLIDHITVTFPNDHTVAGTFTTTWTIFNTAGTKIDTCTMSKATWSATRQ